MRYWGLRNNGVVFNGRLQLRAEAYDTWATTTATALGLPEGTAPTSQQVLDHAVNLFEDAQDFFARTVGGDWASLAPFTTFDADWVYTPTQVQVDQLKADLGLDAISLLGSLGTDIGQAMRPWDPAVRVGGAVNVTGATVTLVSQAGTVGRTAEPVTILADDILEDRLTDAQLFELQLTGQRGDAVPVTDGFQLHALRPLVTAASHRIDASGPAGVAVAQPTGTLQIGSITASQGTVDLAAHGDIVNANGGTGITTKPLTGSPSTAVATATLFSRSGSIGTADSPVAVTGGVVTAGVLTHAGETHIDSAHPILVEDPPKPQPSQPGEPQVPSQQSIDRLDLRSTDITTFALGGTTPGDGAGKHDQMVVTNNVVLDGVIAVQLSPDYVPQAGERFTIMTYQSVVGRFVSGSGLFGLADDVWFEIEQTGDATTAGAITLVTREFLPGTNAALNIAETLNADVTSTRSQIGLFLNHNYFGIDVQVTFSGGFTYGEFTTDGTVTLRYASDPDRADFYEASVIGTATVGSTFDLAGEFLISIGVGNGSPPSLALLAEDIDLDVEVGGETLRTNNGRIGLLVSEAGVAFEASTGLHANLSSDLSLYADEIFVSYNGTEADYTGVMWALGDVSYTFCDLAADTFSIGVSRGEIIAGNFFQANGSFAIEGRSQPVTLADGSTVTADVLTIGGEELSVFAGTRVGTVEATGVSVENVAFAVALVSEPGENSRRWLTAEGTGQSASVVGITGVTGTLTDMAMSLNLTSDDGSLIDYAAEKTILTVATGATGVTLSADGSAGRIIRASGTGVLDVEGSLAVSGTVGVSLDGSSVVLVGTDIDAEFGSADAENFFHVENASFGLLSTDSETAFELTGGLSASIAGFASVSADRVVAQYTSANTTIVQGRTLDTGTADYSFASDIAKDTVSFAVEGFSGEVADFVTLRGDVGFRSDDAGFVAVGRAMTATLDGGSVASLSAADGDFGLRMAAGETALDLSAKNFQFKIANLPEATADTVFFRYTSSGSEVQENETLAVADVSYTFSEAIAANTVAFSFTGFETALSDVLTLSGDLGFAKSGDDIVALGVDINVILAAGSVAVSATDGTFGLITNDSGLAFELQGGFSASIGSLLDGSADRTVVQYASSGVSITSGLRLAIGAAEYTFEDDIAADTFAFSVEGYSANVAGFTPISGDIGFTVIGDDLIAVGEDVSVGSVDGTFGGLQVEDATFGLVANDSGTAFELNEGSLQLQLADLVNAQAGSTFVQFSTDGMALDPGLTVTAGGLTHTFVSGMAPATRAFAATDFTASVTDFVTLSGDVGFTFTDDSLVAIGENVTATLTAGDMASLSVTGRFGLRSKDDAVAIELNGTNLAANVAQLANVSAEHVFVQYTSSNTSVDEGETLQLGEATYTFTEAITPGTVAFDVGGLSADLFGLVAVNGDIGFTYRPVEQLIAAYGTDFSAAFTIGDDIEASISDATFDVRVGSQFLFDVQGEARLKIFDLIDNTYQVRVRPDYTTLTLDDGSEIDAAVLSFAAVLPDLFFGANGGPDGQAEDRMGVTLEDATFGFALATELEANRSWVAAKAGSSLAGFVGIDEFTASVADAAVVVNTTTVSGDDGR